MVATTESNPIRPRQAHACPLPSATPTNTHKPTVLAERRNKVARRPFDGGFSVLAPIGAGIQTVPDAPDNEIPKFLVGPAQLPARAGVPHSEPGTPPPGNQNTEPQNKQTMKTTPLILAGSLLLALPALAQNGPPAKGHKGPGRMSPEMRQKMLEKFDKDGDGKLDEKERMAARKAMGAHRMSPEMRKKMLEKFDKDGDGKLNEEEIKAAHKAARARMEAHHKKMLKRFDKDGDGKLSKEERKTMKETMHKELLEKYDKDGDGKLNKEERQAAIEAGAMPPRRHGMRGEGRPGGPDANGRPGNRGPKADKKGRKGGHKKHQDADGAGN